MIDENIQDPAGNFLHLSTRFFDAWSVAQIELDNFTPLLHEPLDPIERGAASRDYFVIRVEKGESESAAERGGIGSARDQYGLASGVYPGHDVA